MPEIVVPGQGLTNIGVPQVGSRALLPMAIEVGLLDLVQELVPIAMDKQTLLARITETLERAVLGEIHPALNVTAFQELLSKINPGDVYNAINMDALDRLLEIANANPDAPVMEVRALPTVVMQPGPAVVTAGRDMENLEQVNVAFTAPPEGAKYEVYLDYRLVLIGDNAPQDGFVYEHLLVPQDDKTHSVRVLYRLADDQITPFGQPVYFS